MPHNRYASATAVFAMLASVTGFGADAQTQPEPKVSPDHITRAEATRVVQAALEDCVKRGQPASVVVVDVVGFQRAAFSDDNANAVGLSTSSKKAAVVLAFKVSTRSLQMRVQSDKQFADQYGKDERYHFSPGGVPIYKNEGLVAVIAEGGARNIDEDCAYAGLKTLSWAATELPARSSSNNN